MTPVRPFKAKFNGTCCNCHKPIWANEHWIQWDKTPGSKGRAWHLNCVDPTSLPGGISSPAPTPAPTPAPVTSESAVLKQLLELLKSGALVPPAPAPTYPPQDMPAPLSPNEEYPEPEPEPAPLHEPKPLPKDAHTGTYLDSEKLIRGSWEVRLAMLIEHFHRIMLVGVPGTGKSTRAAEIVRKALRILCHEDMGTTDFRGNWQLKNGSTEYAYGPSVIAMKDGRGLVLDEFERTSMECRSLAYNLLDNPPHDMLPNGEAIVAKVNGGYAVVATSNEMPDSLPAPILDRFDLILFANTPSSAVMSQIHPEMTALVTNSYNLAAKNAPQYKPAVSARNAIVYTKLRKLGVTQSVALELVYHHAAKEVASAMATAAASISSNGGSL